MASLLKRKAYGGIMNKGFDDMMAELRVEYVASLPSKIQTVHIHHTDNNRELLRDDFHKLKGTGKTYGIPEISTLGEVVEQLCLNQKVSTSQFVGTAIDLLRRIHQERTQSRPFEIKSDSQFQDLENLLRG